MSGAELALRGALYIALVVGLSNLLIVEAIDRDLLGQVRNGIASLAASVLSLFRSDVSATGQTVWLGGSAVEIVNGCTGIDVSIFLAAAMLVYPAAWRAKLRGVVLAFAVVLAANFLRVLILSWLNAGWPRAFELAHVYVLPALILVVCVATLLAWIRSATPRDA